MTKIIIGIAIAFLIGAACRYFDLPLPVPNALLGIVLIVTIYIGYVVVDSLLPKSESVPAQQVELKK